MTTLTTVDVDRAAAIAAAEAAGHVDDAFADRLDSGFPGLHDLFARRFGDDPEGQEQLAQVVARASTSWNTRPLDLKVRDAQRLADPDWLQSPRMLGGACYIDRYAGNLAGVGDQIPYFRELGLTYLHLLSLFDEDDDAPDARRVNPSLGTMSRLADLAAELRLAGISLAIDVPVELDDEPATLRAAADDLFFLANQGVDVLRVTASAPDIRLLEAVLALAAPGAVLASTAASGAPLADDPLQAALTWEALATRDARLLQRTLERRHTPPGTTWLTFVRSQDAIAWDFAYEDAAVLGIDPVAHRRFLTDFFVGRLPRSFARGVPFAEDPEGGEAQVSGTTASLAGLDAGDPGGEERVVLAHAIALSAGGVPVLYLGDEVAQLNDDTYTDDPARRDDSRWVHRGNRPRDRYAEKTDAGTAAGRVFRRLTKLIAVRQTTPEFGGSELIGFHTPAPAVLGYQRPGAEATVLVLANVGDDPVTIDPLTLSGFARDAHDLVHGVDVDLDEGLTLSAHGFAWLRVTPL